MAKQTFNQILVDLVAPLGITEREALTEKIAHKIDLTQLLKEATIIKDAYRATLDDYFKGNKKSFDTAQEAWHNLGMVMFVTTTLISIAQETNRSIWK